jgi:RNase adapter protein RapZ
MAEFVVICGLSGAGRSEAAKHFEDLGWFVIDNLPAELILKVAELATTPGSSIERVALVVGGEHHAGVADALQELGDVPEVTVRTLFLQARVPVLVQRYETTRRRHPFKEAGSLADAIAAEALALDALKADADIVIDTSDLNVHQLRDRILELFSAAGGSRRLQTRVVSFGFKNGVPLDVDLMFDCRFLPNPYWAEGLRELSGLDQAVKDYLFEKPQAREFLEALETLFAVVMPAYADEGKSYLTIAFGCTGGQHRSVAIAEAASELLDGLGFEPKVSHRDMSMP